MPTYEIQNEKTGEVKEIFCSYDEKVKFFKDNPDWKDAWNHAPSIDFDGKDVLARNDSGWKDHLGRIAERHPTSPLGNQMHRRTAKEIKTQQIVDEHRKRKKK